MAIRNYSNRKRYLKDKKVSIIGEGGEDENGYPLPDEPIPGGENIWAYYRQASGEEYYAAARTDHKVEAIFRINWRDDIEPKMKILFRGQEYSIERIDDFEGYKKDLTIYAYTKEDD